MITTRIQLIIILILTGLLLQSCATEPSTSTMLQQAKNDYAQAKYSQAFIKLLRLAKKGNPKAQYAVGYMRYYGLGIEQDSQDARYWLQQSASNGNKEAKQALSLLQIDPGSSASDSVAIRHNQTIAAKNSQRHTSQTSDIDWLGHQKKDAYTIILMTAKEPSKIDLIKKHKKLAGHLAKYRFLQKGDMMYGLTYGLYDSTATAKKTLKTFKPYLKKTAKIKTFAAVQSVMLP